MNTECLQLIENLNNDDIKIRLGSLKQLMKKIEAGELDRPQKGFDVNNHIHTTYSFSPYSPSYAIWMSYNAGLATVGIMDHDSISGANEFIEAGKIAGIATTIGIECRVDFSNTPLAGKRMNNPDQDSIVYMALHGIPHNQIKTVNNFFEPYRLKRNIRNTLMVEKINSILKPHKISIDFEKDVVPLSKCHEGGSITERHISYALALKLISKLGKGYILVDFLKKNLKLSINTKIEGYLLDESNKYYDFDLLGLIKSEMISSFYIMAGDECPDVREIIAFSEEIGAISAYAYLGDVGDSVTGDKKAQQFEDSYLEELFNVIKKLGFNAVTYMPSRNTHAQIEKVRSLCKKHDLFQISGEDINSPRQVFICAAMRSPEFFNLQESAWALIGHERQSTSSLTKGMFARETILQFPDLDERTKKYSEIGLKLYR